MPRFSHSCCLRKAALNGLGCIPPQVVITAFAPSLPTLNFVKVTMQVSSTVILHIELFTITVQGRPWPTHGQEEFVPRRQR